jgi:GNAT superfamily N-acetyltransferase
MTSETAAPAGFEILAFDPGGADEALWRRFHAYRRLRHAETRPDDPLLPDELVEADMRRPDPYGMSRRHVALADGAIVGYLRGEWMTPANPGYESNRDHVWVGGAVLTPYRRRGLGTAWARLALAHLDEAGASILSADTEEADGHAFLQWLGAEGKLAGAENRLDLHEVDWDMVERWIAEGRHRSPHTRLEFYEHRVPEAILGEFSETLSRLLNTMPFDELAHGDIVVTPELIHEFYKHLDDMGASVHTFLTREPDGTISGITDVEYVPAKSDRISQMFTGVDPVARGRGLGKWIKASMLVTIRERYPDVRWITTGNAQSNEPMLAINRKLGFKTYKQSTAYQISRDKLAEALSRP